MINKQLNVLLSNYKAIVLFIYISCNFSMAIQINLTDDLNSISFKHVSMNISFTINIS